MAVLTRRFARKPQAVMLSPIQLAWRRSWKSRFKTGMYYTGIAAGSVFGMLLMWMFFVVMLSFA